MRVAVSLPPALPMWPGQASVCSAQAKVSLDGSQERSTQTSDTPLSKNCREADLGSVLSDCMVRPKKKGSLNQMSGLVVEGEFKRESDEAGQPC